jgi:hypothetical protein
MFFIRYREEVRRTPFTAPKVDMATNTGMIQAMYPYSRFAKVCGHNFMFFKKIKVFRQEMKIVYLKHKRTRHKDKEVYSRR